jgi:hypothetical protein
MTQGLDLVAEITQLPQSIIDTEKSRLPTIEYGFHETPMTYKMLDDWGKENRRD